MKKIAFLFLIYDTINLEELWKIFFTNVDKNKYTIYIHYKNNIPLKYFEKYKLKKCIKTEYATISLVKAQNILLKEALKDKNNKHFIFLSNSCIPFKNFEYIYNNLLISKSYFNLFPHIECFPRCDVLLNYIDSKYIQKASQWSILNRKHSKLMIDTDNPEHLNLLDLCDHIYAPDEHYYIIKLFLNNLEDEIITTFNSTNDATTFVNWHSMSYRYASNQELKNYNYILDEEIIYLLRSKCFFGRKFNPESINSFLNSMIYLQRISS